jgi:hypothetical protein
LQKEHVCTSCNLLGQSEKLAKKLEEKLAKKDQDALAKTERMKTNHREEKKRIRNNTASDKAQLLKKIKSVNRGTQSRFREAKKPNS